MAWGKTKNKNKKLLYAKKKKMYHTILFYKHTYYLEIEGLLGVLVG